MPFIAGTKPEQIAPMGLVRRMVSWTILRMRLLPVYSLEEFRQTRFMLGKAVLISDAAVFGIFRRDDSDTTTADDGQDCILTADDVPFRFKRRTLLRKYTPTSGTDTSMETGSVVYDADFLHVKTASGTIEKIPFRLQSQGNVVASTVVGGPSDANYWAKIGSVSTSSSNADITLVLCYTSRNNAQVDTGLIRISARRGSGAFYYYGVVSGNTTRTLGVMRIIRVSDMMFDIWVQKTSNYIGFNFVLVSFSTVSCTITFFTGATWQATIGSAEPYTDTYPESGCGSCTTATRPMLGSGFGIGYNIWDTTISKQIFWNGTAWKDAQGAAV